MSKFCLIVELALGRHEKLYSIILFDTNSEAILRHYNKLQCVFLFVGYTYWWRPHDAVIMCMCVFLVAHTHGDARASDACDNRSSDPMWSRCCGAGRGHRVAAWIWGCEYTRHTHTQMHIYTDKLRNIVMYLWIKCHTHVCMCAVYIR